MWNLWDGLNPGHRVEGAQSKRPSLADAPSQQRMRADIKPAQQRKPTTDQKKVRRQMNKSAVSECPASSTGKHTIVDQNGYEFCTLCGYEPGADSIPANPEVPYNLASKTSSKRTTSTTTKESTAMTAASDAGKICSHCGWAEANCKALPGGAQCCTNCEHDKNTKESTAMTAQPTEAELLTRLASATTLEQQSALQLAIEEVRAARREAAATEAAVDWAPAEVPPTLFQTYASHYLAEGLPPASASVRTGHSDATDWLGDLTTTETPDAVLSARMRAEATRWYTEDLWSPVKQDAQELSVQAKNAAGRTATSYGLQARTAASVFLAQVSHLASREGIHLAMDETVPTYVSDGKTTQPVGVESGSADTMDEWDIPGPDKNDSGDPKSTANGETSPSLKEGEEPEKGTDESVDNPNFGDTSVDKSTYDVGSTEDKMLTQQKGSSRLRPFQASTSRTAISVTNVGIDSDGNGTGTANGKPIKFRLSEKDRADLKAVLYSDLNVNFSGVDIEQSDIISEGTTSALAIEQAMAAEFSRTAGRGIETLGHQVTADGLVHAPSSEAVWDGDSEHKACEPEETGKTTPSPDDVTCPECRERLGLDDRTGSRRTAADPAWLSERNNDPYGTPPRHEFWNSVDWQEVNGYRVFQRDGRWFGHHQRQNYWMKDFGPEDAAKANTNLDMWASKQAQQGSSLFASVRQFFADGNSGSDPKSTGNDGLGGIQEGETPETGHQESTVQETPPAQDKSQWHPGEGADSIGTGGTEGGVDIGNPPYATAAHHAVRVPLHRIGQAFRGKPVSPNIATFGAALEQMRSVDDQVAGVSGRQVVSLLLGSDEVPTGVKRYLAAHLEPHQAWVSDGGATCESCGEKIERDPEGEKNRGWHHADGSKHEHEARPGGAYEDSNKAASLHREAGRDPFSRDSARKGVAAAEERRHTEVCPQCGATMTDIFVPYPGRLEAHCDNCGWRGSKNKPGAKSSARTAADYPGLVISEGGYFTVIGPDGAGLGETYDTAEEAGAALVAAGGRWNGHVVDSSRLGSTRIGPSKTAAGGEVAEVSALPGCDICRMEFSASEPNEAKYNGKTRMGPWAYMCPYHFKEHGTGLGTGRGQKLVLRKDSTKTAADDIMAPGSVRITPSGSGLFKVVQIWGPTSGSDLGRFQHEEALEIAQKAVDAAKSGEWAEEAKDAKVYDQGKSASLGEFHQCEDEDGDGICDECGIPMGTTSLAQAHQRVAEKHAPHLNNGRGEWKAQVAGNGEMVWSENALTFDTPEEARQYIAELSMNWFGFDLGRVVKADTPNRQPVDLNDPSITHNFRTGSLKTAQRKTAGEYITCKICAAFTMFMCQETVGSCPNCGTGRTDICRYNETGETLCLENCLTEGVHFKAAHTDEMVAELNALLPGRLSAKRAPSLSAFASLVQAGMSRVAAENHSRCDHKGGYCEVLRERSLREPFSISDAKNEDGEWIMSPEQIRSEMYYQSDPYDDYDPYEASRKTAEAEGVKCPECGTYNDPEADLCEGCNRPLFVEGSRRTAAEKQTIKAKDLKKGDRIYLDANPPLPLEVVSNPRRKRVGGQEKVEVDVLVTGRSGESRPRQFSPDKDLSVRRYASKTAGAPTIKGKDPALDAAPENERSAYWSYVSQMAADSDSGWYVPIDFKSWRAYYWDDAKSDTTYAPGLPPMASSKTAMPSPAEAGIEIGDIFYSSWGYDQTNIDFYEVTRLMGASVAIRPIQSRSVEEQVGGEYVVAVPGAYTGGEQTKRIKMWSDSPTLSLNSYSNAYVWDGKPKFTNAGMWGR